MGAGDTEVVRFDRDLSDDGFHEGTTTRLSARVGKLDPNKQLGGRYRRDNNVVLIADHLAELAGAPFGRNENRGV